MVMEEHSHTPEDIAQRLAQKPKHSYLRDWIYGGIDGAITTFAIVAGVMGAGLQHYIIIILGIANVVADGFSMAASNYISVKSEQEEYLYYQQMEHEHIEKFPEGEVEEIRQIYQRKGFTGKALESAVNIVTSDSKIWVDTMLHEEFGLPKAIRSPHHAALATFSAFLVCGIVPLLPFFFGVKYAFVTASASTLVMFFVIGSLKSRWSVRSWLRSGIVTLLIGSSAAVIAYGLGKLIENLAV